MKTNKSLLMYCGNTIMHTSNGVEVEVYPAKGVSVQVFNTKEELEAFIKDNNLVYPEPEDMA